MAEKKHVKNMSFNYLVENETNPTMYFYCKVGWNYINLLKQIRHIRFPNLQFINLRDNNIESVEGFSHIFMPELDDLFIGNKKAYNRRK